MESVDKCLKLIYKRKWKTTTKYFKQGPEVLVFIERSYMYFELLDVLYTTHFKLYRELSISSLNL